MKTVCLLSTLSLSLWLSSTTAHAQPNVEAPCTLTFKMLAGATYSDDKPAVYPEELKKLEGKQVVLTGFVSPFDDPANMKKFMLTQSAVGCFFCNPPEPNGVMLVRLPKNSKPLNWDSATLAMQGTLHLNHKSAQDPDGDGFLFTMDDAKVVGKK
jgi:hypothetical protein